jgi:hypothetical protein
MYSIKGSSSSQIMDSGYYNPSTFDGLRPAEGLWEVFSPKIQFAVYSGDRMG